MPRGKNTKKPVEEVLQPTTGVPQGKFDLPGFNLPLNWTPHPSYIKQRYEGGPLRFPAQGDGESLFPTALDDADIRGGYCALPLTALREFTMLHIMNSLTDKPGWEVKVFDDEIAGKWKTEAIATEGADVSEKMMNWVIAELRYKAKLFNDTGSVIVYNGDVVKNDSAISNELKTSLREAVKPLEDVLPIHKDYHPGSNDQVLDLVHPSLFPLIYGRSRVLENSLVQLNDSINLIGKGKTVEIRPESEQVLDTKGAYESYLRNDNSKPYSRNFQWLPCDVDISNGDAKITSYINNLHPQHHSGLYDIISQIISKAIPLWSLTLSGLKNDDRLKRISDDLEFDPDPDQMTDEQKPQRREDEDEDDHWDRVWQWEQDVRKAVPQEPAEFTPPADGDTPLTVDLIRDFSSHGLQVIVKLANIELTPEKPEYAGGSWHVEGQLNEHICSTALYYYDNENISDSQLAFRQMVGEEATVDIGYPQNVHGWLEELYGVRTDEPSVQVVGSISCKEDRLLTFPNILQHQVQPFKLADPMKPGHRKILALFLVDPHIRVISTANVPPQQRHWWSERVNQDFSTTELALGALSNELKDKVYDSVDDFPIGLKEAKEIRLQLMEERKRYAVYQDEKFTENTFSLCEH